MLNLLKHPAISYLCSSILVLFISAQGIDAQVTDSVTATVTPANIALSVDPGTVTYGYVSLNSSANTTASGVNQTQTINNDGNVDLDFDITGTNSDDWTIGLTQGADIYKHEFCVTDCDSSPTWTAFTTSYVSVATDVESEGSQDFDLRITLPTTTTSYDQQNVNVTVRATESS